MHSAEQFRPSRQTMANVKPSDYVPFEHSVKSPLPQSVKLAHLASDTHLSR